MSLNFFSIKPEMRWYRVVDSLPKLVSLRDKMSKVEEFCFDTETNTKEYVMGPNDIFRLVGISISWGEYNNYYIPIGHRRFEDYSRNISIKDLQRYLKPIFEREDIRIIGHNLKFDMHVLARVGIKIKTRDVFDTMIASWLCDENTPNGLKECSNRLLGIKQTKFKEVTESVPNEVKKEFGLKASQKATFDLTLIDESSVYALADSFYTWELYRGFLSLLEEEKMDKIYFKVYTKFIHTLFNMEETGATIDVKALKQMDVSMKEDLDELLYQIYELSGVEFNPKSSQQLSALLFGYASRPVPMWEMTDSKTRLAWRNLSEKEKEKKRKEFDKKLKKWEDTMLPILDASFGFRVISTTDSGNPSVDSNTLWKLSKLEFKTRRKREGVELCNLLCDYKKLEKLHSAFVKGLSKQIYEDGKVHPSFNIIGTDSGRLSCSNPNLQQLPKAEEDDKYQIRSLFVGSEYYCDSNGDFVADVGIDTYIPEDCVVKRKKIVALDFANLEMRVLAHFSEDKNLLDMFAKGEDTHGSTAVNMFELDCTAGEAKKKYPHLRQAAKVINFLLMYGGGAYTLYENLKSDHFSPIDLGDPSYLDLYHVSKGEEVAQIYIDKYFDTYSGVAKFIKNQKRFAKKQGYVYTLLRRKRRLPDIISNDYKKVAYSERLSVNSAVQGSAADITISAQNRVDSDPWYIKQGVYMLVQVHDELVFECPEKYVDECIRRTKHYMEHCFGDNVRLNLDLIADADSGDSYQEAK